MVNLSRADYVLTYSAAKHPAAEAIERASTEIARSMGLLTNANRARFTAFNMLVPYVYPTASPERAIACAEWCNWLFFFDDVHDEDYAQCVDIDHVRRLMEHHLRLLSTGEADGPLAPLDRLTLDFRERALGLAGDEWFARFCNSAGDYLFGGVLPAVKNWVTGRTPGVEEYLIQRECDGAVHTAIDLIELVGGFVLPESFLSAPPVRRMRRAAARTIAYFNDIVSYPKEVLKNGNPNNLVHALMTERGCSFEDAIAESIAMVNAYASEMLTLEEEILAERYEPAREAALYTTGMRRWQRGNIEWSFNNSRYASAVSPFAELRPAAGAG